jgi:hypothetical protein
MAKMILVNPRARRKTTHKKRRRNPAPAVKVVTVKARRRNPIKSSGLGRRITRRRRNPINIGFGGVNLMTSIKGALIGAGGAIAVDAAYGQLAPYLPTALQRTPGQVGAGDAVKAAATVLLGQVLKKATRGLSQKMAEGALTVQATEILRGFVPTSIPLGYAVPGRVVNGSARVGPIMRNGGMHAYMTPGRTALLNGGVGAYMTPGRTALLNGARAREGSIR